MGTGTYNHGLTQDRRALASGRSTDQCHKSTAIEDDLNQITPAIAIPSHRRYTPYRKTF